MPYNCELMVAAYQIPSLSHCAMELVFNAIDAGSSCIAISVDPVRHSLQVIDNGTGISSTLFPLLGQVPIGVSNDIQKKFGRRGATLKHISVLSKWLRICSKTDGAECVEKTFALGEEVEVRQSHRPAFGTTVSVGVLFERLPVRIKSSNISRELERISEGLTSLCLLFSSVSFSLRNETDGQVLTQLNRIKGTAGGFADVFRHQFGHLFSHHLDRIECPEDCGEFKFVGYVAQCGVAGKHLQFVFVNFRPIFRSELHSLIITELKQSAICRKTTGVGRKRSKTDQTGLDPVFIFHLQCHPSLMEFSYSDDQTLIRSPIWSMVQRKVRDAIKCWLKEKKLVPAGIPPQVKNLCSSSNREKLSVKNNSKDLEDSWLPEGVAESMGIPIVCPEESGPESLTTVRPAATAPHHKAMGNRNRNLIMESQSMRFAREFRPRPRSERIWRPKETPDEDIGNMNLNFEFRQQSEYDDPNEEHQHQFLSDCFDFVFTKDMLKAANIIGQFDKKFLCCTFRLTNKKGVILAAVDQHAADERVQLEKLRRNYRLDTNNFASQRLPTPLSIELLELDVLVLTDNQNQLNHFGVEVRKISATTVLVTRVPSALFGEEGNTSSMSASPLRTLLSDLVNIFKDGCVGWPVPAVLRESVATEACHRAIKFGDLLSEASSQQLLSRLSDCQLPFQCAHGRPTIIPLKLIL